MNTMLQTEACIAGAGSTGLMPGYLLQRLALLRRLSARLVGIGVKPGRVCTPPHSRQS